MPRDEFDREKLIKITEPEKTVNGLTWDQFHQALAQKGYPDPEHDNHVRAVFNLSGEDHPEIAYHAEIMLGYEGELDERFRERSEERVLQLVEEEVLNPARLGQEYLFDESQRETILYCERALNESGKGINEYQFEDYNPTPEPEQAEEPEMVDEGIQAEPEEEPVQEEPVQEEEPERVEEGIQTEPEKVEEGIQTEPEKVEEGIQAAGPEQVEGEIQAAQEAPAREEHVQEAPAMEEPAQDDPNLIPVNNAEEKTIGGLKWQEFCNALKANGWPEPEKDNNIRAAFNLADANHQNMADALDAYAKGQIKVNQDTVDYQVEALRHAARDAYILAAKNDQNFTMDENQRQSVLHFQEQCNQLEGEHFDFNAYHPEPVQENQQPVQENQQPVQENQQPVQENQQPVQENQQPVQENQQPVRENQQPVQEQNPQPEPVDHDKELDHNSVMYGDMHRDMQAAYNRLEDETVGVYFGSSEYSKAMDDVKKVSETWADLKDKDKDFQLSDHELEEARQKVYEAQQSVDKYLDKKAKERNGKSLSTETGASYYRQEAMLDAKKALQEQADMLDEIAAQRGMEQPLPSDEKLARQRKLLADDLEDATRNVHNGSSEYKEAKEKFDKLNDLWDKTLANKAEGEIPSAGEIANLRANIEQAKQATDQYLDKKADVSGPKAKTEKRISAMSRARENLVIQEKKLAEWEKKLAEQEPVKDYKELADNTTYLKDQMAAADRGVIGGSKEFKDVSTLLKQQEEKWKALEAKGPDYKMTPEELREMVELNQKIEKSVDKYISDKAGKDLSETTQKRLRVMQKVKNHNLSQRKKFEARRDEMLKEVEGISNQQVEKQNKDVSIGLRDADRRVFFGSKAYKNAMVSYNRSLTQWRSYQAKEAAGTATYQDRNAQYKSIQENISKIDAYLKSKEGKDLSKHPKTKKRVEMMQKARENLQIRMRKIENAYLKQQRVENEATKQRTQTRRTELQTGIKSQKALERNAAKASLAATKKLEELGSKKTLTELDQKYARIALASLVVEEIMKQPGNEKLKAQLSKGGKEYSKAIRDIANSKAFQKAFPDKLFTPANCRNLSTNPKSVHRCTEHFMTQLGQKTPSVQPKQLQNKKEVTKNPQMENTMNK